MRKRIIVVGPHPDMRGGIASVLHVYRAHGLFREAQCQFLATTVDGSRFKKLLVGSSALLRFVWLIATGQAGLLHVHAASFGSFWRKRLFVGVARRFSVPVIYHLHSGLFRGFYENKLDDAGRNKARRMLGMCQRVFCLNSETKLWLESVLDAGVRVDVFPNPIEICDVPARRSNTSSVLFLGRLVREKGVYELLRAFSPVCRRYPGLSLVLCGTGPEEAGLRALADELSIAPNVIFPGWVDGARKSELLAEASVFVLPSYAEGLPMSILEAMVANVPIVATAVGGIPDMLDDGACGQLVPPRDEAKLTEALMRALDAPQVLPGVSRAAQRVRELYAAEAVISRLRTEYAGLLA
ncbi:MAG: glycosyltransferase [Denitromonas halophila]|nr:MAG: glycosyltransferase [Denitromonas halophila]